MSFIAPDTNLPTGDSRQDLSRRNVSDALDSIRDIAIINGVLLEDVALRGTTTVRVYHNLGRAYRGYIVVSNNRATTVAVDEATNQDSSTYIALKSLDNSMSGGSDSTVSLWVF